MLGDKIKEIRLKRGLKQSELAQMASISREAVGNYERGDRIPNIEITQKIATALKVNINELLNKEDKEKANALSLDFHIEQMARSFGYEITGDPSEGYLILRAPDGEYEIGEEDLKDLHNSTCSFMKFKLQEIKDRARKIGR